jgi:hypothetical protein
MDLLIATGRLAQQTVREAVGANADVLVLDIEIAAFITPGLLGSACRTGGTIDLFDGPDPNGEVEDYKVRIRRICGDDDVS